VNHPLVVEKFTAKDFENWTQEAKVDHDSLIQMQVKHLPSAEDVKHHCQGIGTVNVLIIQTLFCFFVFSCPYSFIFFQIILVHFQIIVEEFLATVFIFALSYASLLVVACFAIIVVARFCAGIVAIKLKDTLAASVTFRFDSIVSIFSFFSCSR
jgi:hypothetical protein